MRALLQMGHEVTVYEPESGWSLENLREEERGEDSLRGFRETYAELDVRTYRDAEDEAAEDEAGERWRERLRGVDVVMVHEWNAPELAQMLLRLREPVGYRLLFHDTHHRASSSPEQMERFGLTRFDGILAFGEALRAIYRERFGVRQVWVLHEAADTTVFRPHAKVERRDALVWIGNWGEGERSEEICEFLLRPAQALAPRARTTIYGVRYPESGLAALRQAGADYGGYLANLDAPRVYAGAKATVHIPRQQYSRVMRGIPTIRVFESLACGIPLVSAPWEDCEHLFRRDDLRWASNRIEMTAALRLLLTDTAAAEDQAARGLEMVLAKHTCQHRAEELTAICEEVTS